MKKTIAFILAFLPGIAASFSQPVFPESDAIWNYHQYANGTLLNGWVYGLSGDTLIDNVSYSKLYLLNDTILQIDEEDKYLGGFRQEDKKVWFRPAEIPYEERLNREYLLFDFGKEVGELIYYDYLLPQSGDPDISHSLPNIEFRECDEMVTKVEETPFGRKVTVDSFGEYLEGVGCLNGMFGYVYLATTCGPSYSVHLARFIHNSEIKYLHDGYNELYCHYGGKATLQEESFEEKLVDVRFNGVGIEIKATSSVLPFTFELIDITGQRMSSCSVDAEYSQIPFDNYSGVLLYRIKNRGGVVRMGKIITSK